MTPTSAYALRPYPGAPVATPLEWSEVHRGLHPSQFNAPARFAETFFSRRGTEPQRNPFFLSVSLCLCVKNSAIVLTMTPDIPPDALARIAPILDALEASFRPLARTLNFLDEPATTFSAAEEAE